MKRYVQFYDEWIKLYQEGKSTIEIGQIYNVQHTTVWAALKSRNIDRRPIKEHERHKELEKYHAEWVELYKQGIGTSEIARKYNMDDCTVWRAVSKYVKCRTNSEAQRIYHIGNENVFEVIDTHEKAYWLGFLMADGNVMQRKNTKTQNYLQINLKESDIEHIEKFKKFIDANNPISKVKTTNSIHFAITSEKIVKDLIDKGCVPKKSLILEYPDKLDDKYCNSFALGYFDGDGSVIKSWQKCWPNSKKYGVRVSWCCGSMNFLSKLQAKILLNSDIDTMQLNYFKRKYGNVGVLKTEKKENIRKLYSWLYKDTPVWLDRKKQKFEELIFNDNF